MALEPFSWRNLYGQLVGSTYLQPGDDLSSERGLAETACKIIERMHDDMRLVPWTPERLRAKGAAKAPAAVQVAPAPSPGAQGGNPSGGSRVTAPQPVPRQPNGGGQAVLPPIQRPGLPPGQLAIPRGATPADLKQTFADMRAAAAPAAMPAPRHAQSTLDW